MTNKGILIVRIDVARDLRNLNWVAPMNPFCVWTINEVQEFRTNTHTDGGRNPKWNFTSAVKVVSIND